MEEKETNKKAFYEKWWFWLFIIILIIISIFTLKNNKEKNIVNNDINTQNISNTINTISNQRLNINSSINKENEKKHLIVSNGYRFKNSVDEVTLYFEEIYITPEWRGIKPHNDYFLIMKAIATSNTPSDALYDFPYIVSDSSKKQYISINNTFNYDYEDSNGNIIDIATEINSEYVKKEKGKISAYNTNFVSGGKGTRYLVFDIPKETAEDSKIYFVFSGTTRKTYESEAPSKDVYFSEYIERRNE